MVLVTVVAGDDDVLIGEFEFQYLPRTGDEIGVPASAEHRDVRFFTVREVCHFAMGAPDTPWGPAPRTVLRYCEEIL